MMAKASSSNATTADKQDMPRGITPAAAVWLRNERKISAATLAKLDVGSDTAKIYFGYASGWKARSFPEKKFVSMEGTKAEFWNLRQVLSGPMKRVYITEGELDACSLVESGIDARDVLSVPSGTSGSLEYAKEALKAGLSKVKQFIWCGDSDEVGLEIRSKMAAVIGTARFHFVEWPEGIKDANEYLCKDGAFDLHDMVTAGTTPWPADGLFIMSKLPEQPPLHRWQAGFGSWIGKVALAPATMSVVTGHPGMGKTHLWAQIWYNIVNSNNEIACIATFETIAKPHYQRVLRQLRMHSEATPEVEDRIEEARREARSTKPEAILSHKELADIDKWIDAHYLFAQHKDRRPDLDWLLEQAEVACVRHGAKILQLDPWNRLEASREGKESETDYIGRCLRVLYDFAKSFNCHVQVLAHPSKSNDYRRGTVPELEDIAGSKHWDNMVDQGFVVHRPRLFDENGTRLYYAELHHKKARFEELGYPTKLGVQFDPATNRFFACDLQKKQAKQRAVSEDDYGES